MVKRQIFLCVWVSLIMSLVLPILLTEVFTVAHDIDERPDQAAFAEAIERGKQPEVAMDMSMREIVGLERITHHFQDWFSFQTYLAGVMQYFIVIIVATLIVSLGKLRNERAT